MGHKMTNTHKIDKTVVSNLQTDLNNKAETSLSNLSSTGRHYVAFKGYDSNETYSLNDTVVNVDSNNEVKLYQSLANNNTSSLSDNTKWKEVSLGSCADVDLSNLSNTGESHFQAPLVSGTNIKTINGNSILGSGNLALVQQVNEVPAQPETGVLYVIPES